MIGGIGFTLSYVIYFQFISETKDFWFGVSPEGIGFIGMFINFFVAFIISSMTPAPPTEVQKMVESKYPHPQGSGDCN